MSGPQALSTFYKVVQRRSPRLATLMTDDIIKVARDAILDDQEEGQHAANRLLEKARSLPFEEQKILWHALALMDYAIK